MGIMPERREQWDKRRPTAWEDDKFRMASYGRSERVTEGKLRPALDS